MKQLKRGVAYRKLPIKRKEGTNMDITKNNAAFCDALKIDAKKIYYMAGTKASKERRENGFIFV